MVVPRTDACVSDYILSVQSNFLTWDNMIQTKYISGYSFSVTDFADRFLNILMKRAITLPTQQWSNISPRIVDKTPDKLTCLKSGHKAHSLQNLSGWDLSIIHDTTYHHPDLTRWLNHSVALCQTRKKETFCLLIQSNFLYMLVFKIIFFYGWCFEWTDVWPRINSPDLRHFWQSLKRRLL